MRCSLVALENVVFLEPEDGADVPARAVEEATGCLRLRPLAGAVTVHQAGSPAGPMVRSAAR